MVQYFLNIVVDDGNIFFGVRLLITSVPHINLFDFFCQILKLARSNPEKIFVIHGMNCKYMLSIRNENLVIHV